MAPDKETFRNRIKAFQQAVGQDELLLAIPGTPHIHVPVCPIAADFPGTQQRSRTHMSGGDGN